MWSICVALPALDIEHVDNDYLCHISFRLGNWVRWQRVQYKRFMEGKSFPITQDRIDILNDIGFIWDPWHDSFDLLLSKLVEYKETHGNSNVPKRYKDNPA